MPRIELPDGEPVRDAAALTLAVLRGDEDGQDVILANCDLQAVVKVLALIAAGCVAAAIGGEEIDLDQPGWDLTPEQLRDAEAFLVTAFEMHGEPGTYGGDTLP